LVFRYTKGLSNAYENAYVLYGPELKRHALKTKGDLYISHNLGALPAAVKAAKKWNAPAGFDAEDYHRGETSEGSLYLLASKIEDRYIPALDYLSAASPLIADQYSKLYPGVDVLNINNAFSKKFIQPVKKSVNNEMRLFWFSQIVGIERGLENVIKALNELTAYSISIHLLGNCTKLYKKQLLSLSHKPGNIHFLEPVPPDEIFKISAQYDIGLATEVPHSENRKICLTNKLYTYVLAGNCILASDTPAQKKFMEENPGIGIIYKSEDALSLAEELKYLYNNKFILQSYREKAHSLASRDLNWETEFQRLSQLISEKIN
jgi:glycosyltransferase involved in cell wall biosynthesis